MGWLFGIIKSNGDAYPKNELTKVHDEAIDVVSLPQLYLALGGIQETCFYEFSDRKDSFSWAVVGLGIKITENAAGFLDKDDWKELLSNDLVQTDKLDGHFVAFRWKENLFEFFTDQLGLRTAYYDEYYAGICFSTRLDWVAQVTNQNRISTAGLGSRWLLYNQLDYESCVQGIERLGPSAHLIIKNGSVIKKEDKTWLPEFRNGNGDHARIILDSLVKATTESEHDVSLALSGGFDSRTILAILLAIPDIKFKVHTYGESENPDVKVSKKIADNLGIQMQHFNEPIPEAEVLLELAQSFAAQNVLVESVSSIIGLRYYQQQYERNQIIIDGGLGEISRRQYLNRVAKFGSKFLTQKNISKLLPLIQVDRADIFNNEYKGKLVSAAYLSLEKTLEDMPSLKEIGVENFVDLFSVRTRIPNFGGPEQIRLDGMILNYMPMAQPSFLREIFKTRIGIRANGQLFMDIVGQKQPNLKKFPLVKGGTTYPYGLSMVAAWIITKAKSKLIKPYSDFTPGKFLAKLKDYVLDIAHSSEVKNWEGYDYEKIFNAVDSYYKGEKNLERFVNWWLTFELWRKSLLK